MKIYRKLLLVTVLSLSALIVRGGKVNKPDATGKLIKQAKLVARRGNIAATRAAYEKVFAVKDLSDEQRADAYLDIAQVLCRGRHPKFKGAMAEYNKALALKSISEKKRCRILMLKAAMLYRSNFSDRRGSYHTRGIDAAQAIYEKLAESTKVPNNVRIAAYKYFADCLLDKMMEKEAVSALKKALTIPGLKVGEKELAQFNLGRCYRRQTNYKEARKIYDRLLATSNNRNLKKLIVKDYLNIFMDNNNFQAAEAMMKKYGWDDYGIAKFYGRRQMPDKAVAFWLKALDNPRLKERVRWRVLCFLTGGVRYNRYRAWLEKYLDEFLKTDPGRITFLTRRLGRENPEFLIWAANKLLAYDKLKLQDRIHVSRRLISAYLDLDKCSQALDVAKKIIANQQIDARTRARFQLIADIIKRKAGPARIRQAAEELLQLCRSEKMPRIKQAELLGDIAKVAVCAFNDSAATAIDTVRSTLIKQEPRRSFRVQFVDNAPYDISAWLRSPYINEKGKYAVLDRKYGNNLKNLLATDAAITNRSLGASNSRDSRKARFSAVCDADGIHLFLLAPCRNFKDVADGLERVASYEMYLAPGKNEPYHCLIMNPGSDRFYDKFHTMYRNRHYRRITVKNGTVYYEKRATPQGVAAYLRIPWIAFYDKIPQNGDKYEFEAIYWANGGYSWGGSKSVHNRSSFGDWIFSGMTPQALNSIKRRIISRAYSHYKDQKAGSKNGVLDFWEDPELGDPKFYNTCLRKMVEKLDEYGRKIKPGMSDKEVELLYDKAVPKWLDIEYVVADLRSKYLRDKFFKAN